MSGTVDWGATGTYWGIAASVVTVGTVGYWVYRWWCSRRLQRIAATLGKFLTEGQQLLPESRDSPLKIREHNDWVERAEAYLGQHLGSAYVVRFSDFSGMTFYGDGSERSNLRKSVDGRSRRLHEFIAEVSCK